MLELESPLAHNERAKDRSLWLQIDQPAISLVIIFSLLYFAQTLILAGEKTFWFDEIRSLEICRLPTFHAAWNAVLAGADFNPPLFYLIQRGNRALFGEGLIALRLPEIVGFWIFSLCLFRFVSKRAGLLAGWVAMLIPSLSIAYYYAYEVRPHGLVLGFSGVALICWQMCDERPGSWKWPLGFAIALEGAALTHCYAILIVLPFATAELVTAIRSRTVRWRKWSALVLPPVFAVLAYLPLIRSYRTNLGTPFSSQFPPNITALINFYPNLLGLSVLVVLVVAAVLFGLERSRAWFRSGSEQSLSEGLTSSEATVTLAFLCMPVLGVLLARLINGPFFARYFTSTLIGICVALRVGMGGRRTRGSLAVAILVTCLFAKAVLTVGWHKYRGVDEISYEPSTGIRLNTNAADPLAIHPMLKSNPLRSLPVLVPDTLEFYYLLHYAPALASNFSTLKLFNKGRRYLNSFRHIDTSCCMGSKWRDVTRILRISPRKAER